MNQVGSLNFFQNSLGFQNQYFHDGYPNIIQDQRDFFRHQLRNGEAQALLDQNRNQFHISWFDICLTNLVNNPNRYNINKLKEIYYCEPNQQLKLQYQAMIRGIIIYSRHLHINAMNGLINIVKGNPFFEGESYQDQLKFFLSLFNVFSERRFPYRYLNYLELIYEMFVKDKRLTISLRFQQQQFEKILDPCSTYNIMEVREVGRICEELFGYEMEACTIHQKSHQIINLFQIVFSGQNCVENAQAIFRLTSLLNQISRQDRTHILREFKYLIPLQLNILALNNQIPQFVQTVRYSYNKALIFCNTYVDEADQQSYLQGLCLIFIKLPTITQKLDFFHRFWLSIYNKELNIFKCNRGIFWQFEFWHLIEQVFSVIQTYYPLINLNQLICQYNNTTFQQWVAQQGRVWYSPKLDIANQIIENFYKILGIW